MRATFFLIAGLYAFSSAYAESKSEVQFAGVAFISEHQDIGASFPYSAQIINDNVSAELWRFVSPIENTSFQLVADHLADSSRADSIVVAAIALDSETVSVEYIGGVYKLLVDVSVQLLFFDYKKQTVIATYPITIEHIDALATEPSEIDRLEAVRAVLLGKGENGLFGQAQILVANAKFDLKEGARVGLRNVQVQSEALAYFPPAFQQNPRSAERMLAQEFSRHLAKSQQVAVLPYVKGQAIGNRMATRLASGQVFNLAVPEPDFAFDVSLDRFKKVEFGQSAAGTSWIYGSFVSVSFSEPFSGKEYLKGSFKNGETKSVPVTQLTVDDWPSFKESLGGLLSKLTHAFGDPKDTWVKHATDNRNISDQLAATQKVLSLCK